MDATEVFVKNIEAYNCGAPVIVNQGGTRSSKTFSILQILFVIAIKSIEPLVISVVSRALPHLKLGAMRDFEDIIASAGWNVSKVKNVSNSKYQINKSIIEFFGADSHDKVHGPSRDILFVNEANYIKYSVFDQLAIRTSGTIFIDFNPTSRFWFHDEIIGRQNHTLIKSTYLDNNFLSSEQIARIEAKRHNENWWKVYGLGELGTLEGAILTNWEYGEFPQNIHFGFGLDFGVGDPDALIKTAVDQKQKIIYWKEEVYQQGLRTSQLSQILKSRKLENRLVVADSSARRTILDLRAEKLNVVGVRKYAGSVMDGIRLLQDYKIIVDPSSEHLPHELDTWVWVDERGGVPLDANNHCIDAGRYYVQHTVKPGRSTKHKLL